MTLNGYFQLILYVAGLILLVKPLGLFMAKVYQGEPTFLDRVFGPVEQLFYRLAGVRADEEMDWKTYAIAMLVFNILGLIVVYAIQRLQAGLPFNPQAMLAVSADSSFNTAASFATNTNWQGYGGESTMSYFTQMLALAVQNFVSAATGMAVLVALIRGFARQTAQTIGSFWVDLVRSTLYILLPLSIVFALILVWQGVPQTLSAYQAATPIQASANPHGQLIALGPVASQIAIKQLGTNGGGFFNANSAHPFENPTPSPTFWSCWPSC